MIESPRWVTTPGNPHGVIVWESDAPPPVAAPADAVEPVIISAVESDPAPRKRGRPRKA